MLSVREKTGNIVGSLLHHWGAVYKFRLSCNRVKYTFCCNHFKLGKSNLFNGKEKGKRNT